MLILSTGVCGFSIRRWSLGRVPHPALPENRTCPDKRSRHCFQRRTLFDNLKCLKLWFFRTELFMPYSSHSLSVMKIRHQFCLAILLSKMRPCRETAMRPDFQEFLCGLYDSLDISGTNLIRYATASASRGRAACSPLRHPGILL